MFQAFIKYLDFEACIQAKHEKVARNDQVNTRGNEQLYEDLNDPLRIVGLMYPIISPNLEAFSEIDVIFIGTDSNNINIIVSSLCILQNTIYSPEIIKKWTMASILELEFTKDC